MRIPLLVKTVTITMRLHVGAISATKPSLIFLHPIPCLGTHRALPTIRFQAMLFSFLVTNLIELINPDSCHDST